MLNTSNVHYSAAGCINVLMEWENLQHTRSYALSPISLSPPSYPIYLHLLSGAFPTKALVKVNILASNFSAAIMNTLHESQGRFVNPQPYSSKRRGFVERTCHIAEEHVKLQRYNQKQLHPKFSCDGEIDEKKMWSCGSTAVPVQRDASSVHCASPSLNRKPSQAMRRRMCYKKYLKP